MGPDWHEADLIFTTELGTPVDPRNLLCTYERIVANVNKDRPAETKLRKVRFHDLRHSAASLLLAQGVPLRTIMEILGHSSIAMTANLYSHVLENLKRDAADAMDKVLAVTLATIGLACRPATCADDDSPAMVRAGGSRFRRLLRRSGEQRA